MSTPIVPAGYRSEWALFDDWCRAYHLPSCPADPMTVAHFLDFDPDASPGTLRRRIAAVNTVHRRAGHEPPGTATAVRRLLSLRDRRLETAQQVIHTLPTTGWPSGLFGRRDALLLHLVCVIGIPGSAITDLQCSDLRVVGTRIHIGGPHQIDLPIDRDDPHGLLQIWTRWAHLQQLMMSKPSPRSWITPLRNATPVDTTATPPLKTPAPPVRPGAPLLPAFDRWGTPLALPGADGPGLSARAVHAILAVHLGGGVRRHLPPASERATPEPKALAAPPAESHPAPLRDVYADGIAAKHRTKEQFSDIDDVFAEIDRRTQALLEQASQLLDSLERA